MLTHHNIFICLMAIYFIAIIIIIKCTIFKPCSLSCIHIDLLNYFKIYIKIQGVVAK